MKNDYTSLTGGCLCGKVKYTASHVSPDVAECHCGQCRRQTGHRYAAVRAQRVGMELKGMEFVTWFTSSSYARRGFCSACGSHLFWAGEGRDYMALMAASVDEPNNLFMERHTFCEGKGAYYDLDDRLPQFEGYDQPVKV